MLDVPFGLFLLVLFCCSWLQIKIRQPIMMNYMNHAAYPCRLFLGSVSSLHSVLLLRLLWVCIFLSALFMLMDVGLGNAEEGCGLPLCTYGDGLLR